MKRKVFSSFLFAALLGMGMVGVTSCADYDEDIKVLQDQVNEHTKVSQALQTQVNGMETQIKSLQEALNAIKSCTCGDVDKKIADAISKALADLNYSTPEQVADAISKALAGINTGLTADEVQALINAYHAAHPGCQCGDIQALIEKYLKDNPGLSETDVEAIVKAYHNAHPQSTLTENDVKSIVETYINQLQHFTKEQIEDMINTAITQALANYVQKSEVYTKSQVEELVKEAIEEALKGITHPESGLNKGEVDAIVNAAIEEALKGITHPESGLSKSEVDAIVSAAITEALKGVKPGITEAEVQDLIDAAKCNCPALTTEDVTTIATSVIEKYMQEHPYTLDTTAVENICNNVINNSEVINNIKSSISTLQGAVDKVREDLENLKDDVYTKSEVENLINTLIAQAIKNCNCDNTALSPQQQAIVNNLISQAINNYNAAHPDCNCQYDAAAFQALVDAVAANTSAIQGLQPAGDYVTSSQLQQAIQEVKDLIPAAPDLSDYVTVATYNADLVLVNQAITAASTKAQQALEKANEAYTKAGQAYDKAENAYNKADDAYNKADEANNKADDANNKADDANNKADEANNKADDANNKAEQALNLAGANKILIENLTTTVNNLSNLYITLSTKLEEVSNKAENALSKANSNYFEIETLKSLYDELKNKVTILESQGYDDTEIKDRLTALENELENLATKDELAAQLAAVKGLVNDAKNYAKSIATNAAITALSEAKSYTDTEVDKAKTEAKNYTDIEIGNVKNDFAAADQLLQNQINDINGKLDEINGTLSGLQNKIDELTKKVNALAKLITGIQLQGSVNPAFGYFSLPVGVTSNVLIAYYGQNEHETMFPSIEDQDLVYGEEENWITEQDAERIGMPYITISGGKTLTNGTGNAGKLYLTVNPSNIDFTGTQLKLINSIGEESPVTLGAIKKSTDKLTFGQSRAVQTYFYEAPATVSAANVSKANYGINEQLTDVLKDIKNNGLGANISDLAQAVYNQFNGVLDAYAVQATWSDELGEHAVTSSYNIAAAAIKPLSYNTLNGVSFQLPVITPLSEMGIDLKKVIDPSKFNFSIPEVNVDFSINVNFSDLYVDAAGNIYSDVRVTTANKEYVQEKVMIIDATGKYLNPNGSTTPDNATGEMTIAGYNKATAELIVAIINDRSNAWSSQLTEEFTKQFADNIGKMQKDINDAVTAVGGNLEGVVSDLVESVQDKLNSVLKTGDKFISQLNKLIKSINDNLLGNGNPNLRLQGHIFYSDAKGRLHPMSTAKGIPTVFTGEGEAIELNLSSYTGEILAPAFKKYIAVTNVYKDGHDADNSSELKAALKAANDVEDFNQVFNGDRYAVAFHPTVKGAVYEIVYSALDFHGHISQRKYYVRVD